MPRESFHLCGVLISTFRSPGEHSGGAQLSDVDEGLPPPFFSGSMCSGREKASVVKASDKGTQGCVEPACVLSQQPVRHCVVTACPLRAA